MISITLKKYRTIDLTMLAIVGVVVEMIGIYLISFIAPSTYPAYCVSILIIIVAVIRWDSYGLILVPVFSLAGFLAGKYLHANDSVYYTTGVFFSNFIGMLGCAIMVPIKKHFYKKGFHKSVYALLLVALVTIISVVLLQGTAYAIIKHENWISSIIVHFGSALFCMLVTMVFLIGLKTQNAIVDVKTNFIEKAEEAKKEKEYYANYTKEFVIKKEKQEKDEFDETSDEK